MAQENEWNGNAQFLDALGGLLTYEPTAIRTPAFRRNAVFQRRMANTASARKRIRQTLRRTERNRSRKSRMRTFVKKIEVAIAGGEKEAAVAALRAAQPEMQRASAKGVVHRNAVARKLSRLSARIKKLGSG